MDADQMPAGPELDLLVAERVMGTKRPHEWVIDGYPGSLETWEACHRCDLPREDFVEGGFCIPGYSTDIASAWELVEKCGLFVGPFTQDQYWAFESVAQYLNGRASIAGTAPLAICRAALKVAIPGKGDR